jgi:hypothetical protein
MHEEPLAPTQEQKKNSKTIQDLIDNYKGEDFAESSPRIERIRKAIINMENDAREMRMTLGVFTKDIFNPISNEHFKNITVDEISDEDIFLLEKTARLVSDLNNILLKQKESASRFEIPKEISSEVENLREELTRMGNSEGSLFGYLNNFLINFEFTERKLQS